MARKTSLPFSVRPNIVFNVNEAIVKCSSYNGGQLDRFFSWL